MADTATILGGGLLVGIGKGLTDFALEDARSKREQMLLNIRQQYQSQESAKDREFRAGEGEKDRTFRSGESATDRSFRAGESALDRSFRGGEGEKDRGFKSSERQATEDFTIGRDIATSDRARTAEREKAEREGGNLIGAPTQDDEGNLIGVTKAGKKVDIGAKGDSSQRELRKAQADYYRKGGSAGRGGTEFERLSTKLIELDEDDPLRPMIEQRLSVLGKSMSNDQRLDKARQAALSEVSGLHGKRREVKLAEAFEKWKRIYDVGARSAKPASVSGATGFPAGAGSAQPSAAPGFGGAGLDTGGDVTLGPGSRRFDAESSGYDDARARAAGMTRAGSEAGENAGHMGSVAETTPDERKRFGLPDESYILLKGRKHESWDKAVAGEEERGFQIVKRGDRYFSVPRAAAGGGQQPQAAPPAPRDERQRKVGQVYTNDRGRKAEWTGRGWKPVQ